MKKINELMLTHKVKITFSLMLLSILSFAVKSSLNAQVVISGPKIVCTSAQFSINCGGTITWSCTSNLTLTSGQGTSSATFASNGNGDATIYAEFDCGGHQIKEYEVWVGAPIITWIVDEGKYPEQHLYDVSFWPAYYHISEPEYSLDVDYPGEVWYCDQSWAQVYLPGDPSEYSFLLISTNTCGYDWTVFYWDEIWGEK